MCIDCWGPPPPPLPFWERVRNAISYSRFRLCLWVRKALGLYVWNGSVFSCLHSNPGCEECVSPEIFRYTRQYPSWVKWGYFDGP